MPHPCRRRNQNGTTAVNETPYQPPIAEFFVEQIELHRDMIDASVDFNRRSLPGDSHVTITLRWRGRDLPPGLMQLGGQTVVLRSATDG